MTELSDWPFRIAKPAGILQIKPVEAVIAKSSSEEVAAQHVDGRLQRGAEPEGVCGAQQRPRVILNNPQLLSQPCSVHLTPRPARNGQQWLVVDGRWLQWGVGQCALFNGQRISDATG